MDSYLSSFIREIENFPKPGIVFKDITTLLKDPIGFQRASEALQALCKSFEVDKVAGIESRGFMFGAILANTLGVGFVPIRKSGKLPAHTLREEYQLEYGADALEIHLDAIQPGDKVLIHDDLLATGGTAVAACNLVEKAGGQVAALAFLVELTFLKGREKLQKHTVQSVIQY
ncbi:MAG: adenine phosphoribosyltransferase [Thermonemataceae bacterium]